MEMGKKGFFCFVFHWYGYHRDQYVKQLGSLLYSYMNQVKTIKIIDSNHWNRYSNVLWFWVYIDGIKNIFNEIEIEQEPKSSLVRTTEQIRSGGWIQPWDTEIFMILNLAYFIIRYGLLKQLTTGKNEKVHCVHLPAIKFIE